MTEPDVALTDYALAVECAVFAWLIWRRGGRGGAARGWWVLFFAAAAVATLAGGTVHGFFSDAASRGAAILWPLSLVAVGVTALAGWALGARLALPPAAARWVVRAAVAELLAYAAVVLFVSAAFWVAIVNYLPPALFFLVALVREAARRGRAGRTATAPTPPARSPLPRRPPRSPMSPIPPRLAAAGVGLMFVAAALQQLEVALHPLYFDHDALYHAVQAVALALVYAGCRGLLRSTGGAPPEDAADAAATAGAADAHPT